MAAVTYIEHDGTQYTVEIPDGTSLMQAALDNGIAGIVGECGGSLSCATCLCFVDSGWVDRVGAPEEMEKDMLEFSTNGVIQPGSRLSCQIIASDELNGLVVRLPESQF